MSDMQISDSSGGTSAISGGAAGSISISYWSRGIINNNVHSMSDMQISHSSGGTDVLQGAAAGGVSLSYYNKEGSNNNSHFLSNVSFLQCRGGDRTQGAGALVVHSLGPTSGMSTRIEDAVFLSNRSATSKSINSPSSGAAGAVLIFAQDGLNRAWIRRTEFVSNSLDSACTGGLCLAGALATSIQTDIEGCRFYDNFCTRNSGGVYSDATLAVKDSVFSDNTARSGFAAASAP